MNNQKHKPYYAIHGPTKTPKRHANHSRTVFDSAVNYLSPCGKRKKNKSQPDYALLYTTFKKFLQKGFASFILSVYQRNMVKPLLQHPSPRLHLPFTQKRLVHNKTTCRTIY